MCGILGIVGPAAARLPDLAEALDVLRHRGPDDRGEWNDGRCWLGHRRLSIIDLTAAGHQPMVHPRTGVVIVFNGEIYNYLEVRDELRHLGHTFRSQSDTEVLLAAYLEWGAGCLPRLNGMWSFVIWDPRSNEAFFSRDRLGVKPLYYTVRNGTFAIASEPKAIVALFPELRRVDEATLYDFLAEGRLCAGPGTFYEGITSVSPGHYGTYAPDASAPRLRRYWALPTEPAVLIPYADALERFAALFEDSTRLRMRSDVPVGVTLSGGLDSSAILHAATKVSRRVNAFTSVYASEERESQVDERHWARLVADRHPGVMLAEIDAGRDRWLTTLPRIVHHMDGPGYSPAVYPLWGIMERARAAGVPVLLEGQGADELIGGYPQYAIPALRERMARPGSNPGFWAEASSYASTFGWRTLALWTVRALLPGLKDAYRRRVGTLGTLRPEFRQKFLPERLPEVSPASLNAQLGDDLTRAILPGLLQYGDAISMAHSVESRLPFLDYRLVEFAATLPGTFKVGNGESKRVLRDYLRRSNLAEVGDRRDKQGYPTPVYEWMAAASGEALRSLLLSPSSRIREYCEPHEVSRLVDSFIARPRGAGNHLYRLLTTELWLRDLVLGANLKRVPSASDQYLSSRKSG